MIEKTLIYLWTLRVEFVKYFVTGLSGVFLDIGSLILLKEVFGLAPVIAVVVNQAFMLAYIFLLNKYWSFRNKEVLHRQIVRFLTLALVNYCISVFIMYVFNHRIGFDYRLVRLCTIALMVSWNFFLYKNWVYKS